MKVKICGITDAQAAFSAVESGADALGFVFAESKRKITPERAKEIAAAIPAQILKVGVFVNESKEMIEKTAAVAGLNVIQLHGDESPEYCKGFSVPIIKALSIGHEADLEKIREYDCEYILLDSPKGKYRGGNGTAFDWSLAKGIDFQGKKLILAGGLNPENVEAAIDQVQPFMVDVSSGVETDGKKDLEKISSFILKAKGAKAK